MNSRQRHALRVISSILVGLMAFFVGFLFAFSIGVILFAQLQTDLFLTDVIILFLAVSVSAGLIIAAFTGISYYRYLEKSR